MSASVRRLFSAVACAGVLVAGSALPVSAADLFEDPQAPKPAVDMTLASNAPFVPSVKAPALTADTQTPPPVLSLPRRDTGFAAPALRRSLIVSFGALQALDAHSTMKALKAGGSEANPLMSGIVSKPAAFYAVKAGTAVATALMAEKMSRNHPKAAMVMMAVLNSAYVAIVAHNYRVARVARAR